MTCLFVFLSKIVPHATALAHHVADKHTAGNHLSIKPDWAVNGTIYLEDVRDNHHKYSSNNYDGSIRCDVCKWMFSSENDYQLHLKHLRPITDVTPKDGQTCIRFQCDHCGREFKQHRSLKQHFNMCSVNENGANIKVQKETTTYDGRLMR